MALGRKMYVPKYILMNFDEIKYIDGLLRTYVRTWVLSLRIAFVLPMIYDESVKILLSFEFL